MNKKTIKDIELAAAGHANGISTQLAAKGPFGSLTEAEKLEIIEKCCCCLCKFLEALGCDWENDPNSADTPRRVAKAYVNDLWSGRFDSLSEITAFPADGYDGIVQESNIPVTSMCSHHHQAIGGTVSIAYVPRMDGKVVGLSKLNRIVDHFARRGAYSGAVDRSDPQRRR